MVQGMIGGYHTSVKPDTAPTRVTACQLRVLRWMAKGLRPAEIAAILRIRRWTVYWHLNRAMDLLDCRTSVQVVAKAIRMGLI